MPALITTDLVWGWSVFHIALAVIVGCGSTSGPSYFDACDSSLSQDECYAAKRDPSSDQVALATNIALRHMDEHPAAEELWDWTSGVFMFAITELHRVTGDGRLRDHYEQWLDHHIREGYEIGWSDDCPPAVSAIASLRDEQNDDYQTAVNDVLHYLRELAPRTDEGGISHLGTRVAISSIWVDSLFMFGMVLNRWGEHADDADALSMMSAQIEIFSTLLQAPGGLMVHAHGWPLEFDTDIYWARGNGWVAASLADYLRVRFLRRESDPVAERVFQHQVSGILAVQDADSGMWWNIMNRPGEIYIETSSAALFAYGMARAYRYGVLGEAELEAAKRAVAGVKEAIETDDQGRPFVTDISQGTTVGTFENYAAIPLEDDLNYGVGAVILALLETSGL